MKADEEIKVQLSPPLDIKDAKAKIVLITKMIGEMLAFKKYLITWIVKKRLGLK